MAWSPSCNQKLLSRGRGASDKVHDLCNPLGVLLDLWTSDGCSPYAGCNIQYAAQTKSPFYLLQIRDTFSQTWGGLPCLAWMLQTDGCSLTVEGQKDAVGKSGRSLKCALRNAEDHEYVKLKVCFLAMLSEVSLLFLPRETPCRKYLSKGLCQTL